MSEAQGTEQKFLAEEKRGQGSLGLRFFQRYLTAMRGLFVFGPFLVVFVVAENFFGSGFKWMVAFWVEGCAKGACEGKLPFEVSARQFFETAPHADVLKVFSLFVLLGLIVRYISWSAVLYFLANGGRHLHDAMVKSLGRVRVTFFDENPTGRLVRRFSGDYSQLSREIPNYTSDIIGAIAELCWIVVIVLTQAPLASIACVPCGLIYYQVQQDFRPASREVQRLSKVLESPFWAMFTETMNGFQTIRAFNRTGEFVARLRYLLDRYGYAVLMQSRFTRWLNLRLKVVSELFALCVAVVVVWACAFEKMGVGTAGFLMSLTVGLDMSMQWLTRSLSMLETSMVSVERVLEFQNLPSEFPSDGSNRRAEPSWPSAGEIVFKNFSMSYRADLPVVLKNFSATFPAGKIIGIIGRTGAGKSSLFQSLFRMVNRVDGEILVDGIDIHSVALDDVRRLFGIIPQEPQLFSGTLRYNLDRTGRFTDEEIWRALETVRLDAFVRALPDGLNHVLYERGSNLSVGQRQLLCMARAILCDAKIVLMDEATASVDLETESLIHDALLKGFAGRTILIIAHRLETVRTCDLVAVLSEGRLEDIGPAGTILEKVHGTSTENATLETLLV